jgi:hypothetical protein
MTSKPWNQLSLEEKIEKLHRKLEDVVKNADHNARVIEREIRTFDSRLRALEMSRGGAGTSGGAIRKDVNRRAPER